ncbi:EAL domain-containing protein [Stutzerimonas azotifigens]|uniref:EAL domain-containing protein n=1 Tax=Stutzerimonas azotifigens TaxID=291995 RepID=UPI00040C5331|nr:EAL domain-containing protein [Stutzerimonas azotifigens]
MYDTADILIVEDSPTQALELQYLLEAAGCRVRVATNGIEALALVAEQPPTVVISDIVMPEMDGYTLCRHLKNDPKTASIPLILVTHLSDARDVVHGLASGADNFIVKPYDEKYLMSRIRYFLVNLELRTRERMQMGVEILLEGERHFITADRQQIFDLLISTYEQGILLNHQLQGKHDELARSNLLLNCLFDFTAGLSDARSEQDVVDAALAHILDFPEASGAWLLLAVAEEDERQSIRLAGARGYGLAQMSQLLQRCAADCPCVQAWRNRRLYSPANMASCPALQDRPGGSSHACIPLMLGDMTIGMLNVLRHDGANWAEEALNALTSIGQQLSMALGRARLFAGMEQQVKLRTLALARSESLLRGVLESLPVGVVVADQQGQLVMSNAESARIWNAGDGLRQSDKARLQGVWAETGERLGEEDWPLLVAAREDRALRNQVIDVEAFDGEQKTILTSAVPFRDESGKALGSISVFQDISQERRRNIEMRIRTRAVEASVNAIVITDNLQPGQPIVYVNPAFERISGYTSDEVLGRNCRFLQGEDRNQAALLGIREALRTGKEGSAVLRNFRKDGSEFWNELTLSPVVNDRGKVSHFVGILHDITEAKRYQSELEHQANHDGLTGLANRNLLNDRIQQAIAFAERNQESFTLVFIDLDRFKVVNDSLGHNVGDRLLQLIARRLQACTRQTDTLARLGGDEFVILLTDSGMCGERLGWLERLQERVAEPLVLDDHELVVSCSIGFSCYPENGRDVVTLLRNADTAMYRAKSLGRNRVCAFAPEMNEQIQRRLLLERQIRHALHNAEFRVVYQPQLDLACGRLCGFEALVRWQREGQVVAPDEFIPLAEETGLIVGIDFFVLDAVCRQLKLWEGVMQGVGMAVNISALTLMDADFVERVQRTLSLHQVTPGLLKLEVTETSLMADANQVLEKMTALCELGIQFSIDDFGTGYSSLGYLKRFPFSQLKIDRSFINEVHLDPDSASLTRSMISIGHDLGIKVIAEGVETAEELGFLQRAGCDELQGFYYSRPLPPEQCMAFVSSQSNLRLPLHMLAEHERYLLLVDDERSILNALQRELRLENYRILTATCPRTALSLLASYPVDVVLTDLRLHQMGGVELLRQIRVLYPDVIRVVLSASTEVSHILKAVNEGVIYRFITKPWEVEDLRVQLREAFRQRELVRDNMRMRLQLEGNLPGSMQHNA